MPRALKNTLVSVGPWVLLAAAVVALGMFAARRMETLVSERPIRYRIATFKGKPGLAGYQRNETSVTVNNSTHAMEIMRRQMKLKETNGGTHYWRYVKDPRTGDVTLKSPDPLAPLIAAYKYYASSRTPEQIGSDPFLNSVKWDVSRRFVQSEIVSQQTL